MALLKFPTPPKGYTASIKAADSVLSAVFGLLKNSPKAKDDAAAQIAAYKAYINKTNTRNSLKKIGFPTVKQKAYAGNISWLRTALNTLAAIADRSPGMVSYLNTHIDYFNQMIGVQLWGIVSNRLRSMNDASVAVAGNVGCGGWITIKNGPKAIKSPRPVFAAWRANEIPLGNALPYDCFAIEINEVKYPLKCNGQETYTIPDGQFAIVDENDLEIPANAVYRVGWSLLNAVGETRPSGGSNAMGRNTISTASGRSDWSSAGTGSVKTNLMSATGQGSAENGFNSWIGAPLGVFGKNVDGTPIFSVLITGDSVAWSANIANGRNAIKRYGAQGYLENILMDETNGRVAYLNFAVPGTQLLDFRDTPVGDGQTAKYNKFSGRKGILAALSWPMSLVLNQMGLNTASNQNAANTVIHLNDGLAYLKGMGNKPLVNTLLTPHSTVSDNTAWTNVASQTPAAGASRAAYLARIRELAAGPSTLVQALFDITSTVESSTDSGLFKALSVGGTISTAATAGANTVSVTGFTPTPGQCLVFNAGTSTVETKFIVSVAGSGPYDLVVNSNFVNAQATGVTVKGVLTNDGIHQVDAMSEATVSLGVTLKPMLRTVAGFQ